MNVGIGNFSQLTNNFPRSNTSMFDQSMPLDKLYEYTLRGQGIIALCFTDGSAPCYDVSYQFHRTRLTNVLSVDNLDCLVGWKVFACPSDAEAFFRAFFYLGGFKVDTTALPPRNTPVAAKEDICQTVNNRDLDHEAFQQTSSFGDGTKKAQRHSLSSEDKRRNKKQRRGECYYAIH